MGLAGAELDGFLEGRAMLGSYGIEIGQGAVLVTRGDAAGGEEGIPVARRGVSAAGAGLRELPSVAFHDREAGSAAVFTSHQDVTSLADRSVLPFRRMAAIPAQFR